MTPYSTAAADILMRHLGLARRTATEIQDLYSCSPSPLVAETGAARSDRA